MAEKTRSASSGTLVSPASRRKASDTLSDQKREAFKQRWGSDYDKIEKFALDLFRRLDTNGDGLLNREEFAKSLGFLGESERVSKTEGKGGPRNFFTLANFLFDVRGELLPERESPKEEAIDTNLNGTIDIEEYLCFVLIMQLGSVGDKLEFAFSMVDINHDSKISKFEVATMIKSIFTVLTNLKLPTPEVDQFVDSLCAKFPFDAKGEIDMEQYKRGCLQHEVFIKCLGYQPERIETQPGVTDFLAPRKRIGQTVFFGQEKWDFMLSVMLGLQLSITDSRATGEIQTADYQAKVSIKLPSDTKKMQMICFAPRIFQEIREAFHVSNADYLLSMGVSQVLGSLLMGDLTSLSELVSEGKSGSFFYFSHDQRFMVKTISSAEARTLKKMLQDYHEHVSKKYPNTLLTRFYGLYELKPESLTPVNPKIHFVVMENIFSGGKKVHERYDLKGSTQGRTVGEELLNKPGVVLRDLDLVTLDRKINVGPKFAAPLRAQIAADTQFLQRNGIVDYSLLLGVHKTGLDYRKEAAAWIEKSTKELEAQWQELEKRKLFDALTYQQFCMLAYKHCVSGANDRPAAEMKGRSLFKTDYGGMQSYRVDTDGQEIIGEEILYIGIIDTLIPYELRKAGEHILKSAVYDGKSISIVPPNEYAPRFASFMRSAIE